MIQKIKLKGFGKHKDLTVDLDPGINAIIGRNRMGKTHIMESICYGLYGKTKNSRLDRIINFDMKSATVDIKLDGDISVQRKRTENQSKLSKIKKTDLEKHLGLSYQEFLSIFYISSHDQKSLFDPSYLRKFLISLFDLEQYSKKYTELRTELKTLQSVRENTPKVNKRLLKERFERVKAITQKTSAKICKYKEAEKSLNKKLNEVYSIRGTVSAKERQIKSKISLMKQGKCPKCRRDFHQENIDKTLAKGRAAFKKLGEVNKKLDKKQDLIQKKLDKIDDAVTEIERELARGRRLMTIIKEKAKEKESHRNTERIRDLEQVLPVFAPKGFPSYLLKVYLPVITETTNNLLQVIFPDIRVKVRTEKPESNKPDFKPLVYRSSEDGEDVLEMKDLCGSECAVVNLCFRLGIMVIIKQLSDTSIDFFMVDEGFERIDNENSVAVLKLFENFMELGYLNQVLLVTHKQILKEQSNINYIEL